MIKRFLLLVCAWRWWCAGLLGLAVAFASGRLAGGYLFPRQISQDRPEEAAVDESSVCLSIPFGILSTQTQEDRDELRKICKQLLAPDFSWDAVLEEHKWLKGVPVAVFLLGQDIEGFGRRGDAVFLYVEIYEKPIDRVPGLEALPVQLRHDQYPHESGAQPLSVGTDPQRSTGAASGEKEVLIATRSACRGCQLCSAT